MSCTLVQGETVVVLDTLHLCYSMFVLHLLYHSYQGYTRYMCFGFMGVHRS